MTKKKYRLGLNIMDEQIKYEIYNIHQTWFSFAPFYFIHVLEPPSKAMIDDYGDEQDDEEKNNDTGYYYFDHSTMSFRINNHWF